ncbi:hypothetical protein J7I84_06375 [Arthrobacter sp. ISL-85]|uniref:DUF6318 family protein n=1 Tax=Arthrobacter sp. ISL-85 TaxID=2819115 RepID=UPI001BE954D0|nr:DUF6318 family protein [Arthrobacter sp. ISL-85]MBT2566129.1 hypothetical protein [Arthrobacter sp. ISL-85]
MTSQNLFTSRAFFSSWAARSGAAALVAGCALTLSGCNSGGSPGPGGTSSQVAAETPIPSATATPTPTPSAVYKPADASGPAQNVPVPVLPEIAKTETKEGAEAFTKHWFSVLSYAYETGDTQRLLALSGPDCVFCKGLVDNIEAAWSDGKWISGGHIETPAVTAGALTEEPVDVTLQVIQKELVIHNPDGSPYQKPTAATNSGSRATATFEGDGWTMSKLSLIR